jgi:hypothetical protein
MAQAASLFAKSERKAAISRRRGLAIHYRRWDLESRQASFLEWDAA